MSSKDGKQLWGIATDKLQLPCLADSNFRSAQVVEDVSGDKVPDIVVGIRGPLQDIFKSFRSALHGIILICFVSKCA